MTTFIALCVFAAVFIANTWAFRSGKNGSTTLHKFARAIGLTGLLLIPTLVLLALHAYGTIWGNGPSYGAWPVIVSLWALPFCTVGALISGTILHVRSRSTEA